eukprot:gene20837-24988_t
MTVFVNSRDAHTSDRQGNNVVESFGEQMQVYDEQSIDMATAVSVQDS